MRLYRRAILSGLLSLALIAASAVGVVADSSEASPLIVGWSDGFSRMTWRPFPRPNAPDVFLGRPGLLRLSLGADATCVPVTTPFYWASVTRVIDVNTDRYPILAIRAVHLTGPSWWDVEVQGAGSPTASGRVDLPVPQDRWER